MILRSLLAVMGLVLVSAVMAQTTARPPTDIPIAEFFKRPAVASPMLSPVEVDWVGYASEGQSFLLEKNLVDFWGRVEPFLARHTR